MKNIEKIPATKILENDFPKQEKKRVTLQNRQCSPAQNSPSPLAASSAFGLSSFSAQSSKSDTEITESLTFSSLG